MASGAALPPLALASAFAGTASAAWWLAGRERGAFVVTGATVAAQLGLHLLFSLMQLPGSTSGAHGSPVRMSHAAHALHAGHWAPPGRGGAGEAAASGSSSVARLATDHGDLALAGLSPFCHGWGMLLAHVLAALLCGLWLWRGERAAFRLGRALGAAVFVPLRTALRGLAAGAWRPPRLCPMAAFRLRRPRQIFLRHVLVGRGPPASVTPC